MPTSILPAWGASPCAGDGDGTSVTSSSAMPACSSAALVHRWPEPLEPLMPRVLPLRSLIDLIGESSRARNWGKKPRGLSAPQPDLIFRRKAAADPEFDRLGLGEARHQDERERREAQQAGGVSKH